MLPKFGRGRPFVVEYKIMPPISLSILHVHLDIPSWTISHHGNLKLDGLWQVAQGLGNRLKKRYVALTRECRCICTYYLDRYTTDICIICIIYTYIYICMYPNNDHLSHHPTSSRPFKLRHRRTRWSQVLWDSAQRCTSAGYLVFCGIWRRWDQHDTK